MFCNKCGKEVDETTGFCRYCGNRLEKNGIKTKEKSKEVIAVVAVVLVVILCIGIVGLGYLIKRNSNLKMELGDLQEQVSSQQVELDFPSAEDIISEETIKDYDEEVNIEKTSTEEMSIEETSTEEKNILLEVKTKPVIDDDMKKAYRDYLVSGLSYDDYGSSFYIDSEDGEPLCQAEFALYDVNDDGYLDLIVSGPLGLRCKMFTYIYMYDNGEYINYIYDGVIDYCADGYISFDDPDYEGAGEIFWTCKSVYEYIGGTGFIKYMDSSCQERYYDSETFEELDTPEVLSENYILKGKEVSKEEYNQAFKKLNLHVFDISYVELSIGNINEYFGK